MSRILILEATPSATARHHPDFPKEQYNSECHTLCGWLMDDLVDILERHLPLDLAALRKVTYPLATRQELREEYDLSDDEIRTTLAEGRQARKAAWQNPDNLISTITLLLDQLGRHHDIFSAELLHALTNHSQGLVWHGEEAYFSTGWFAADLQALLEMTINARDHHARNVRIVIDNW